MKTLFSLAWWFVTVLIPGNIFAAIIFESGTLGETGVTRTELGNGLVPGTSVDSHIFPGVRFQVTQPVVLSEVGGHFVEESSGTFFGVIVALNDETDFPDSGDLSTPDVLGAATLTFPNPSKEVYGNLVLPLDPGWYALVFGSGLFGTNGLGGAVRNGVDFGDPSYVAHGPNLQWFNFDIFGTFFDNHRFVVKGAIVPELNALGMVLFFLVVLWSLPNRLI